ncbi:MAG: DUF2652 domain-containing protein [Armatimonadetes bacterium]|nr:DUF2652 domain-containing protein [Armatimonadota bacterium]MBI2973698.1 DUF2652 domain-containing protein [Armatimonadota bacterium]
MARVQQGCLALGDITGYTKYLAGTELEHSQDVLADLMNVLVAQMRGLLHLAKLEGDAVFCYEHEGEADASTLMAMIESSYFAFAKRLQTITRHTTCDCNACRLIPQLNLKFMVHHGQFLIHEIAGSRELVGREVILVHRLLKNAVTEKTGLRGYAMLTRPCVQRFGLDPAALGMAEHVEAFEDVGEVTGYIHSLERRWEEEQRRQAVYITPGEGVTLSEFELPAPPPIVWDYVTSPAKRPRWQPDTLRVEQRNPRGVAGIGTTNHCVHGDFEVVEEILDWKPFQYFTERSQAPFGSGLFTTEFQPVGNGSRTHVTLRFLPDGGSEVLHAMEAEVLPMLRHFYELSRENLVLLLTAVQAAATERAQSLSG